MTGAARVFLWFGLTLFTFGAAAAQTSVFKYQGSLTDGLSPANGSFQMQFKLCKNLDGAPQIGQTITVPSVSVVQGSFSVDLDFTGLNIWDGTSRFLEISVRRNDTESYTLLLPRSQILSAPYSSRSSTAGTAATAANANQLGNVDAALFVRADLSGNVAIGTTSTGSKLAVAGVIESITGGFKFPDGSTQTSAGLPTVSIAAPLTGNGTPASPPGIQSPLNVRDVDHPTRQPVFASSITEGVIYTVPAGKRLVIEYISGYKNLPNTNPLPIIILQSTPGTHVIAPETWSDAGSTRSWIFSKAINFYVSPGSPVSVTTSGAGSSIQTYMSGYLVDVP